MKKKRRRNALKHTLASVFGMVLVVMITIVGTLAFMYAESNEKKNTFTGTNDIKLLLEEPNYNLRETKDTAGNITYIVKNTKSLDPREYVPGEEYSKDPTLYNTTGKQTKKDDMTDEYAEEWVAMRVDYTIDDGDATTDDTKTYAQMIEDYKDSGTKPAGIIEPITFNVDVIENGAVTTSGNWIRITSSNCATMPSDAKYEIYVYKYKLRAQDGFKDIPNTDAGDTTLKDATVSNGVDSTGKATGVRTTALFESVKIKDQDTLKTNGYELKDLKGFTIKLTGAAIKVTSINDMDEITESDINPANGSTISKVIVEDLITLLQQ